VIVETVNGSLTVSQAIGAGAGTVTLITAETAEGTATDKNITLSADVTGAMVKLTSALQTPRTASTPV
jgi:hypothetical protein